MKMSLIWQEMEEREKMVKHMWDVYTNSRRIRLPKFWQQAFEAAYEDLTSDEPEVREAAISEIAKMSIRSIHFESPPVHTLVSFLPFISVHWFYQLSTIKFISQCTIN